MNEINNMAAVATLADLKAQPPFDGRVVLLMGKAAIYDNLGGFYRWDSTATGAEDTVFMKSFPSTLSATGRWVRIFQTVQNLVHGKLITVGGIKTFYASTTTISGGQASLNLTLDNTETGTAIFQEVWANRSEATLDAANVSALVSSGRKTLSSDLKTTTHLFYQPNPVTITLGLIYAPLSAAPAGVPVTFRIEGI